jgi:hypothetical protein
VPANLIDLGPLELDLGTNKIGLSANLVPKKLSLLSGRIAQQLGLRPFLVPRCGHEIVSHGLLTVAQHARKGDRLLGARNELAHGGLGLSRDSMNRGKSSIAVFAVQPESEYAKYQPIHNLVRIHRVILAYAGLDGPAKKRSTRQL